MMEKHGVVEEEQPQPTVKDAEIKPADMTKQGGCCGGRCKSAQAQDAVANAAKTPVKR